MNREKAKERLVDELQFYYYTRNSSKCHIPSLAGSFGGNRHSLCEVNGKMAKRRKEWQEAPIESFYAKEDDWCKFCIDIIIHGKVIPNYEQ